MKRIVFSSRDLCALVFLCANLGCKSAAPATAIKPVSLFVAATAARRSNRAVGHHVSAVAAAKIRRHPHAPGVYKELIYVQREKSFFKLVGENPTNTILTFNSLRGHDKIWTANPVGTFKTPSTNRLTADDYSDGKIHV